MLGYSDSDCGSSDDRKSISGSCFFNGNSSPIISCKSKKHVLAKKQSSREAEYIAFTSVATQEAKIIAQLFFDFTRSVIRPVKIHVDNTGAIELSKNHVSHQRSKSIT